MSALWGKGIPTYYLPPSVTSFTFQAPGFYERHGYVEFARWRDVPVAGEDDVHLRKELGTT